MPEIIDVDSLPFLSISAKEKYGLANVKVNMPRPATKSRPYASAVIDLRPVLVGERIPKTSARLIGVTNRGIAIEIIETGDKYQISM